MKVIAHEPKTNRRSEHYAIQDGEAWRSLCAPYPAAGDKTHNGKWTVRDKKTGDWMCRSCQAKLKRQNAPPPEPRKLPCTEPERKVELIVHLDGWGLVHYNAHYNLQIAHTACGFAGRGDWTVRPGAAGEITCERCLKSLGLYKGHTPSRRSDGKVSARRAQKVLDDFYKFTGQYHSSDPRSNR